MATIQNFMILVFFLSIISQGRCQCYPKEFGVSQSETGVKVETKPEWKVTINNPCPCVQSNVKLSCDGFQSVKPMDPSILKKSGAECLVKNGNPIAPLSSFSFTYAWDRSFPFKPLDSKIDCSQLIN
ncbi:hypothetical protein SLE2022_199190 [Rubroshorea leprosula]